MNAAWQRMLKLAYRKEPISSFVSIAAAVDVAIGGLDGNGSLLAFGLGVAGAGVVYRLWQMQRGSEDADSPAPEYYLPPSPESAPLPKLSPRDKRSRSIARRPLR